MNKYSYEWVPNAGAANIGIVFINSKSGSFLNPASDGKGTSDFVCWPGSSSSGTGYMFMTPCNSGFGDSLEWEEEGWYSSYSEALNALKKKVININF